MLRSGPARRYATARARARGRQKRIPCENDRGLPIGDGEYVADAAPGAQIGERMSLHTGIIRSLRMSIAASPALALIPIVALVLALMLVLFGRPAWSQQASPQTGPAHAHMLETSALEISRARLDASREPARLAPLAHKTASRAHPAVPGLVLAQSASTQSTSPQATSPQSASPRNSPPPGPAPTQPGAEVEADNPFAPAQFAPMLGFESASAPVIRAQISPRRQTVLSAEIAGKIVDFDLREGDRFTAGDRLIGLDCAAHAARRDRARAQEQATRRRLETAGRLDQLSSISRLEYDEAVAALAAAEAESRLAEIFVARCAIVAPFDGRVSERLAEPYQYVSEGEPLIAILDDQDLEIELIAPSQWLVWLSPGHAFTLRIDELANDVTAQVSRLGARVDPVSQSVKVFAAITDAPPGLMAGMSGLADLAPPPEAEPGGAPDG